MTIINSNNHRLNYSFTKERVDKEHYPYIEEYKDLAVDDHIMIEGSTIMVKDKLNEEYQEAYFVKLSPEREIFAYLTNLNKQHTKSWNYAKIM